MRGLRQFWTLTRLTALEVMRQPLTLLLSTFAVLFIGGLPLIVSHTLGETQVLVCDSALAMHFVCGLLIGCTAACSTLVREIHRGTASAVLSKPVSRTLFFLAKFSGVGLVTIAFSFVTTLAALLSARTVNDPYLLDRISATGVLLAAPVAYGLAGLVNYRWRRPFSSNAFGLLMITVTLAFLVVGMLDPKGGITSFGRFYTFGLIPLGVLMTLAVLVLTALAVSLATFLDVVPTLSICSVLFMIGLMSDYLFGRFADSHALAWVLYRLMPNWQNFWVVDALRNGVRVPWFYVAQAALYAVLYMSGVLSLGTALFRRMELK